MRTIAAIVLTGALLVSTTPVRAGNAEFIAGAVIGFMGLALVDAIAESHSSTQQRHPVVRNNSNIPAARTQPTQADLDRRAAEQQLEESRRRIQNWLNSIGFSVGEADGIIGPRTRTAISEFQHSIGHIRTGQLSEEEAATLRQFANQHLATPSAQSSNRPPTTVPASIEPVFDQPGISLPEPSDISDLIPPSDLIAQSMTFEGTELVSANIRRISILGLTPLADASIIEQSIASNNFDQCTRSPSSIECTKDTSFMLDTLVVGFVRNQGIEQIHTITREMNFKSPVIRSEMLNYFSVPYPQLVAADRQTLSSSDDCTTNADAMRDSAFEALKRWSVSTMLSSVGIADMAAKCEFYYALTMADTDQIESLEITLFAGGPIVTALAENGDAADSALAEAQIQF